jgi:PAS domain S-box-containing protein
MLGSTIQAPAERSLVWLVGRNSHDIDEASRRLSCHHDVEVFAETAEVILRLTSGARPNVLAVDWQLEDGSAKYLCKFVRARWNNKAFPLLALISGRHNHSIASALAAGANDCVTEPFAEDELIARVASLVCIQRLHEETKKWDGQDLKKDARRFRTLANMLPHMMWTTQPDGRVDYFNERWIEYAGGTTEHLGWGWTAALHPEDAPGLLERWTECLERVEDFEYEARLRRHDGVYRWHLNRARPLRDPRGQLYKWFGTCTDIDELKHAKAESERTERALSFLAQASATLTSSLDYDATLKNLTDLAVPTLGDWCCVFLREDGAPAQLVAASHVEAPKVALLWEIWRRHRFPKESAYSIENILRTGQSISIAEVSPDDNLRLADGAEHLALMDALETKSWMMVPLIEQNRTLGALGLGLTRSKRRYGPTDLALTEELARRAAMAIDNAKLLLMAERERRRAEEASRLKDEFLATMSHELRTPLNAILGWAQMLSAGVVPEARRSRALETIERNARAQAKLIEDLLDVSRINTGKLRIETALIDPGPVLEMALEAVRPTAEAKGVRLEPAVDHGVGSILADSDRLRQILWNLLTNAVKFTPAGGRIEVTLRRAGASVEIAVADTGQGIHPDFLPHVFERFRQADASTTRTHAGLGLGLSIAHQLVEMHGGTIRAESEGEKRGATFIVKLPLSAPSMRAQPVPINVPGAPARLSEFPKELAGLKVVIIDDEEDGRRLLGEMLTQCDSRVATASSAAEGLRLIRRFRPDLLLADIAMPGEDGLALIREVRALPPQTGRQIATVAVTACASEEDRARALQAGFDVHLAKPVKLSELFAVVTRLAERLK